VRGIEEGGEALRLMLPGLKLLVAPRPDGGREAGGAMLAFNA